MPLAPRLVHLRPIPTRAINHDINDAGTARRFARRHRVDQPGIGQSAFGQMERSRCLNNLTLEFGKKFPEFTFEDCGLPKIRLA